MNIDSQHNITHQNSTLEVARRLDALTDLITKLGTLHGELADTLGDKFDALRNGALDKLGPINDRAVSLASNISEQDGLRKQLMQDIGRQFGMSAKVARELPARRLAERVTEPQRSRLNEATTRLKDALHRVRQLNDKTGRVSGEVVNHLQEVFRAVTNPYEPGDEYTETGSKPADGNNKESNSQTSKGVGVLFEAIG